LKKKDNRLLIVALTVILITIPTIASDGIFPYSVQAETLDNGLEVVLISMDSGGLIAYWSIVRVGSRDEYEENRTGFAHFFEHMMFRGTVAYPADVYQALTTRIGASTNAFTTDDLTAYHLSIASQDLETVMKIESDRFQNLAYPREMFQTEAGAVYGEYRKNRMNPFFVVAEAVHREAFREHTYGHTAMGYEEDIREMPELFGYSKAFFKRYYRPENMILLIVGPIDPVTTMGMVQDYYGEWEIGYEPPKITPEPPQTAERRIEVSYRGKSLPIVWISYKADAFNPEDRDYVANSLLCDLAFGETSGIYKKLVLEEQVVEFIQAGQNTNRDPGLIDIVTRIKDPVKVDYVISEIDRVIVEAKRKMPDAGRLQELKSRLKYDFLMGLDTPSNVARSLVRWLAVAGTHQAVNILHETAEKITPEDVLSAARKYLVSHKRTVAVLEGAN
jgi:zinc protease